MSKYLSVDQLGGISDRVFRAYKKLPEVRDGPVMYVDPEILLRALLGLNIEYHHLSLSRILLGMTTYSELGVTVFDEDLDFFFFDGKTVLIETDLLAEDQVGRRNFTIIHEGSHHILKMLFPRDYAEEMAARYVFRYRDTKAHKPREEWQVDTLTSFLLMPKELVIQAMDVVGLHGKIKMLNSKWRKPEYEQFCEMCSLLGVSKQALSIRLMQLGLLEEEHLKNPNEILDIYREENEVV